MLRILDHFFGNPEDRDYKHLSVNKSARIACACSFCTAGERVSQGVIVNPIINSAFDEPTRHFRFTDEGIADEEVVGRRVSSYFVRVPRPGKKNGAAEQGIFDTQWTQDPIEVNKLVNDIRRRVVIWRKGGFLGVTPPTSRLIAYWTDPNREKKLFFCQNEALQTAIYIVEVAKSLATLG